MLANHGEPWQRFVLLDLEGRGLRIPQRSFGLQRAVELLQNDLKVGVCGLHDLRRVQTLGMVSSLLANCVPHSQSRDKA